MDRNSINTTKSCTPNKIKTTGQNLKGERRAAKWNTFSTRLKNETFELQIKTWSVLFVNLLTLTYLLKWNVLIRTAISKRQKCYNRWIFWEWKEANASPSCYTNLFKGMLNQNFVSLQKHKEIAFSRYERHRAQFYLLTLLQLIWLCADFMRPIFFAFIGERFVYVVCPNHPNHHCHRRLRRTRHLRCPSVRRRNNHLRSFSSLDNTQCMQTSLSAQ